MLLFRHLNKEVGLSQQRCTGELVLQELTQGDVYWLQDKQLCQEKPALLLCRLALREQKEGCSVGTAPRGPHNSSELQHQQLDISWATPWFSWFGYTRAVWWLQAVSNSHVSTFLFLKPALKILFAAFSSSKPSFSSSRPPFSLLFFQ